MFEIELTTEVAARFLFTILETCHLRQLSLCDQFENAWSREQRADIAWRLERIESPLRGKMLQALLEKAAERTAIQREIADVNAKRVAFIANEQKKLADSGTDSESTLGDAIQSAINKQLKKSGFEFEK